MTREAWEERRRRDIRITGLGRCLDLFGLPQPVAGADVCRGGWGGVTPPIDGAATARGAPPPRGGAPRQARGELGAIGVDMPIGLADDGPRRCDQEARELVGPRRSSVFTAQVAPDLGARTYEQALARSRQASGVGLSKQAWHLVPRIKELDALLDPTRQGRIFECHPEAAFAALA